MLSQAENDLLTQVGPGTPAGTLFRRYWHPVALSRELPEGAAPLAVRLLGEDLTLFRDEFGRLGLLGLHCSHRRSDLSYGRIEDGGLRCLYHGWLYDVHGRILETPAEPGSSTLKDKIQHPAYPCHEVGGVIFSYMGPGGPPLFPAYDCWDASPEYLHATKLYNDCNYLQGLEGSLDSSHLSYLHQSLPKPDPANPKRAPAGRAITGSSLAGKTLMALDSTPRLETEETSWGMRMYQIRKAPAAGGAEMQYVGITNFLYPFIACIVGGAIDDGDYTLNWHTPIDDTHQLEFDISFSRSRVLDKEAIEEDFHKEFGPDFRFLRNPSNRWLQDREEMKSATFSGMGSAFAVHDNFATVSEGPIMDRTQEHLGYGDVVAIAGRRLLLRAIRDVQEGGEAPGVVRDPAANRFPGMGAYKEVISASESLASVWEKHVRK